MWLQNNFKEGLNMNNAIKVLMYHRIVEDDGTASKHWTYVSAAQLRKHLSLLNRWGYMPITFRDYLLYEKGKINLPKKPVIITFDDGFEEIRKLAFPILKEYGWNAVLFVLGNRNVREDIWNTDKDYMQARLLDVDQLREMADGGFEIGSHSMTHANLPTIPHDKAVYEIQKSREVLQSLTQSPIKSFSYPFGAVNGTIKELVREAGYEIGCGVYTGPPQFFKDRFDIRRITINNSTNTLPFAIKILSPYEYYEWYGSRLMRKFVKKNYN